MSYGVRLPIALFVLLLWFASGGLHSAAAASAAALAADQQITVPVGSQTRTCFLHLPPAYDGTRSLPVVITFHGSRGTGHGMTGLTHFSTLGDEQGFIAAYPDGLVEQRTWNALFGRVPGGAGVLADEIDDVAFTRRLIETLIASYHADPERVFVCGFSAGGYMAYRAAVELSGQIAAAGIVCGSLGIKSVDGKPVPATIPPPAYPISLIHVAGARDNAVKLAGAQIPKNLFKPAAECVQLFAQADGCATPGTETHDPEHGLTRTLYTGGKNGTEAELVVVAECGHEWLNDPKRILTSQELWDFFSLGIPSVAGRLGTARVVANEGATNETRPR